MRITSLKYRLQLPGFELSEPALHALKEYDEGSARLLEQIADWVDLNQPPAEPLAQSTLPLLDQQPQTLVTLIQRIDDLTNSLAAQIASELPVN